MSNLKMEKIDFWEPTLSERERERVFQEAHEELAAPVYLTELNDTLQCD